MFHLNIFLLKSISKNIIQDDFFPTEYKSNIRSKNSWESNTKEHYVAK